MKKLFLIPLLFIFLTACQKEDILTQPDIEANSISTIKKKSKDNKNSEPHFSTDDNAIIDPGGSNQIDPNDLTNFIFTTVNIHYEANTTEAQKELIRNEHRYTEQGIQLGIILVIPSTINPDMETWRMKHFADDDDILGNTKGLESHPDVRTISQNLTTILVTYTGGTSLFTKELLRNNFGNLLGYYDVTSCTNNHTEIWFVNSDFNTYITFLQNQTNIESDQNILQIEYNANCF